MYVLQLIVLIYLQECAINKIIIIIYALECIFYYFNINQNVESSFKEFINIRDLPIDVQDSNNILDIELNKLLEEINNLKKENQNLRNALDDSISIIFHVREEDNLCSIICNKKDSFKTVESKLYRKHPELEESKAENIFYLRNIQIDRTKTLEENNIRDSSLIELDKK